MALSVFMRLMTQKDIFKFSVDSSLLEIVDIYTILCCFDTVLLSCNVLLLPSRNLHVTNYSLNSSLLALNTVCNSTVVLICDFNSNVLLIVLL